MGLLGSAARCATPAQKPAGYPIGETTMRDLLRMFWRIVCATIGEGC